MEVIVPEHSGFCPGVKTAERKVFEAKRDRPGRTLYVIGYLINNKNFIDYLEQHDIRTVEAATDIPPGAVVFIRTHGLDRAEEQALRGTFEVIDLTCVHVKQVQREIARHVAEGFFIVITGTKEHPEIRGLVSYAGDAHVVLEDEADLATFTEAGAGTGEVFLCSQTTGSREFFDSVALRLREVLRPARRRILIHDPICPVTERKEREALRLQEQADVSFVIGDKLSSNAKKLFRILAAAKPAVHFIEDLKDLKGMGLPLERFRKALVVSSASTPAFIEREVVAYLTAVGAAG
jgi:4-hydroxy-3-methylbut-2-en-1-yl diphosphate reductase